MKLLISTLSVFVLALALQVPAEGRGFGGGGFGGGGFGGGGFGGGSFSSSRADSFSGGRSDGFSGFSNTRSDSFSASGADLSFSGSSTRTTNAASGWDRAGASSSYDRSVSGSRGGSVTAEGQRGVVAGPGGAAAGGSRSVTATGPDGRTYSGESKAGAAVGPYGRTVGGASHAGVASGPGGTAASSWHSAYSGSRMPTDLGLSHYSSFNTAAVGHSTAYWSHGTMVTHAGYVRTGFGYYNCFHPAWYTAHPGAWAAAGWAASTAWNAATWSSVATYCAVPAEPVTYDFGTTIIYQDNNVYQDGQDVGTAQAYAQQATALADQGQKTVAPPEKEWKALGVFALVQGEEKSSNNVFQLAINKDGIVRGNYYDGLMDTTTPVYGSLDKKTQRIAWTIGKKTERVFDTGLVNLTKSEAPILVHFGNTRTVQMLLVRMEQPKDGN